MAKKINLDEIDEQLLISSIKPKPVQEQEQAKVEPQPELESEKPKESPKRKRVANADYGATFLQRNELKTRQCVYISLDVHNTISKIVNVIADKNITVGGYIDNVLLQHLEANKDEINELYRKERDNLI